MFGGANARTEQQQAILKEFENDHGAARVLSYVGLGLMGLFCGGAAGWVSCMGQSSSLCLMAVAGAVLGMLLGLLVASYATGDVGKGIDEGFSSMERGASRLLPGAAQQVYFGHAGFSLFVTVHSAKNMRVLTGALGKFAQYDGFVTLACGSNPAKSTCVRRDGVFQETFKLLVQPTDRYLQVTLKDQDVMHNDVIGSAVIEVNDVIETGFPVYKAYRLENPDGDKTAQVTLSFDWGNDFDRNKLKDLAEKRPVEFQRRQAMRQQTMQQVSQVSQTAAPYGTFTPQQAQMVLDPQGTHHASYASFDPRASRGQPYRSS